MPNQPTNRFRWERVPILGNNPVFCFEARRIWTRRTSLALGLIVIGLGAVSWAMPGEVRALLRGERHIGYGISSLLGPVQGVVPPMLPRRNGTTTAVRPSSPLDACVVAGYTLGTTLRWIARLGARYLIPALAALSLVGDRAAGRLQHVLATPMSLRSIMIGKAMAPVLPFCLLELAVCGLYVPFAILDVAPVLVFVLLPAEAILALLACALVGMRVATATRQPPVALAGAILAAGVLLPILAGLATRAAVGWTEAGADPVRGALGPVIVSCQTSTALYAVILVLLWWSTKRALTRAAE